MQAGRLAGAAEIGIAVGKVINKYNTGRHFQVTITDTSLAVARKQSQIDAGAALDGFYVLRTPIPKANCPLRLRSAPTRTSNTSSGTSGTSNPTTWTWHPRPWLILA